MLILIVKPAVRRNRKLGQKLFNICQLLLGAVELALGQTQQTECLRMVIIEPQPVFQLGIGSLIIFGKLLFRQHMPHQNLIADVGNMLVGGFHIIFIQSPENLFITGNIPSADNQIIHNLLIALAVNNRLCRKCLLRKPTGGQ